MRDELDPITENDSLVIESIVYNEHVAHDDVGPSPALETYMRQLSKFPILSREQELSLTRNLKKHREVLYLAFAENTACNEELIAILSSKVGKVRRIFDNVAKSVDDDKEIMNLQQKLMTAVKNNTFSKKDRKHFKDLVLPFNDFYRLINILKAGEVSKEVATALKNYNDAKKTLSECNLRLVFARAKRFMNRGMSLEDLIQEGNVGLLKAIEKYDPEKGTKFGTCATWWIDQAFGRALADKGKLVRIPVHMVDSINKVNKVFLSLSEELDREPTDEEVAKSSGMSLEKVKKIKDTVVLKAKYLEELQKNDKAPPKLIDLQDEAKNPEELLEEKEMYTKVREFLAELSPQDEKILRLRFGIGEAKSHNINEIAQILRITRQKAAHTVNSKKKLWDL